MNLIINCISIISLETQKAKIQNFIQGINVITASKIDGNWKGKSSILRSIFHTLGADGIFSDHWEKEGPYVYLLDFNIDKNNYIMLRRNGMFKLFNCNKKLIFSVSNREKLSEELTKLFNQKIFLKNKSGIYSLAPPAYNYVLNYIEQNAIQPTDFKCFKNLQAFSDYYSDLIYSHLGINNDYSNTLKENENQLLVEKTELEKREKILTEMNKEIDNAGGTVLEIETLKQRLKIHEETYRQLANKINKHKQKLNDAYNSKIELENLLKEFNILEKKVTNDMKKELKTHKCPHCDSVITNDRLYYFHRVKEIDGFGIQRLSVEDRLNQIKREIELEIKNYEKITNQLKEIEKEIFSSSKEIKDGLKALGLKEIASKITNQIGKAREKIYSTSEKIKKNKKAIKEIEKIKKNIDDSYNLFFNEMLITYPVKDILDDSIKKASKKFKVDGTHNNIATIMWLCSLLKTKYKFNPNSVIYPLIFDTPNNADFDEINEKQIFELIFNNLPKKGQIITSLVGFEEQNYSKYKVNKIILENQKYQLLNTEDFEKCKKVFNYLNLFE